MVESEDGFEIHGIGKDTSKLFCQIDTTALGYAYTLNGDGSEAAFYVDNGLGIVEVDKVNGSAMDQSAIVTVEVSESVGWICELVYSDGGKLHARHGKGKSRSSTHLRRNLSFSML